MLNRRSLSAGLFLQPVFHHRHSTPFHRTAPLQNPRGRSSVHPPRGAVSQGLLKTSPSHFTPLQFSNAVPDQSFPALDSQICCDSEIASAPPRCTLPSPRRARLQAPPPRCLLISRGFRGPSTAATKATPVLLESLLHFRELLFQLAIRCSLRSTHSERNSGAPLQRVRASVHLFLPPHLPPPPAPPPHSSHRHPPPIHQPPRPPPNTTNTPHPPPPPNPPRPPPPPPPYNPPPPPTLPTTLPSPPHPRPTTPPPPPPPHPPPLPPLPPAPPPCFFFFFVFFCCFWFRVLSHDAPPPHTTPPRHTPHITSHHHYLKYGPPPHPPTPFLSAYRSSSSRLRCRYAIMPGGFHSPPRSSDQRAL